MKEGIAVLQRVETAASEYGECHVPTPFLEVPEPIPTSRKAIDVLQMFRDDDAIMAMPVVDDAQVPVGLVTRRNVLSVFGHKYAHALNSKKSVQILMDRHALVMDVDTDIEVISRAMTERDALFSFDPAIMTMQGKYCGLLSVITLLKRMTDIRIEKALDSNPLSRLPGNNSINREIDWRLRQQMPFMLVYVDLDHFKAFNDHYGYERGDRVIQLLANILRDTVGTAGFIGHVGGDDFVMVLPLAGWRTLAERVRDRFREASRQMYDDAALQLGYIVSENRQGEAMRFPLMSLSMAAVACPAGSYVSHVAVAEVAGEVKHMAKMEQGNSIVENRRES